MRTLIHYQKKTNIIVIYLTDSLGTEREGLGRFLFMRIFTFPLVNIINIVEFQVNKLIYLLYCQFNFIISMAFREFTLLEDFQEKNSYIV